MQAFLRPLDMGPPTVKTVSAPNNTEFDEMLAYLDCLKHWHPIHQQLFDMVYFLLKF